MYAKRQYAGVRRRKAPKASRLTKKSAIRATRIPFPQPGIDLRTVGSESAFPVCRHGESLVVPGKIQRPDANAPGGFCNAHGTRGDGIDHHDTTQMLSVFEAVKEAPPHWVGCDARR